jgi:hypothetical protein
LAGGFESDIATANRGAAEANERATKAQASLALAEQHAAEANTKAEGFRLDIAKANERAASANETAEREKLARLQLEARLADRVLTANAILALKDLATKSGNGVRIDICTFGGTLEVASIAESIRSPLAAGGADMRLWQVSGGSAARGILVGTKPGADQATRLIASDIVAIINGSGTGAVPWDFDVLTKTANSGMRNGPGQPVDAPILLIVGPKQ